MSFQEANFYFLVHAVNQVSPAGPRGRRGGDSVFSLVVLGQVGHTFLTAGLDATFVHGLGPAECFQAYISPANGEGIRLY